MLKAIHLSPSHSEFKASRDYVSPCLKEQTQMVEEMNKDILIQSRWFTVCAALASNMRKLQTRYQGGKIDSALSLSSHFHVAV